MYDLKISRKQFEQANICQSICTIRQSIRKKSKRHFCDIEVRNLNSQWNQPEFIDEIIQGYTVQCFFIEDLKDIQICDDKNITATKLEHTVHNLTSNMTYYFRVRAHTKIVAGPYTDLINVSTTHENPIPKLLVTSRKGIHILDVDLNITNFVMSESVTHAAYSIQDHRIYWLTRSDLMTLKINENNITKIASFDNYPYNLCIDWTIIIL
ncbi:proto-oncogene tyrosine-protein kinase ROS-like [Camponotus floridanus]|uniref:proto-oncogene tyrosine-protein kinase ROS-like n=1 Tax=Camponotus floridanus TaxID=104421 RepID=UPI000DC68E66|nr:proto-oncogene tyrosine-protein kinase ROS-like [Camponotus floridanus]